MIDECILVIKNDFASELNQCLATFYENQYRNQASMTYLYIPKECVDRTVDELVKDKALITRFEGKNVCQSNR
jgi:hypothetical protein